MRLMTPPLLHQFQCVQPWVVPGNHPSSEQNGTVFSLGRFLPVHLSYLIVQPVRMSIPNVTEVRPVELPLAHVPSTDGLMIVSHVLRSLLREIASLTKVLRSVTVIAFEVHLTLFFSGKMHPCAFIYLSKC